MTGSIWQTLTRSQAKAAPFRVRVVSLGRKRFSCGNGVPVEPAAAIRDVHRADIVILPELLTRSCERVRPGFTHTIVSRER